MASKSKPKTRGKPGFTVGPGDAGTTYLKDRDIDQKGYLKDRMAPSEAVFPDLETRAWIYDTGETLFRHEHAHKGTSLKALKLTTVESWRRYGSEASYAKAREAARKKLGLNRQSRARRPKLEQIAALQQVDREMLEMLLKNQNPRAHQAVIDYATELEQQKYFSAAKVRVWQKLRVDLSVPWITQAEVAASGVYELLLSENRFEVPPELAQYCFTNATTNELKRQLELDIVRKSNKMIKERGIKGLPIRRLAEIDVGPDEFDEALFCSWTRMTVHPDVFDALNRVKRPLYVLLHAHALGCHGDITREQIEANWAAKERRDPVTSVYYAGRNQIIIRTVYQADADGELLPWIEVSAERIPLH